MSVKQRTFVALMATILLLVYIFLVFTNVAQAASGCPTPLAHRGLHTGDIDENSIASITHMKSKGAAEIDVHVTKDGKLVLMHDKGVNRTTNGEGLVIDLTLAEVKHLRLEKSGDRVPTLKQAVAAADKANVRLVVELKQYPQWTTDMFKQMGRITNRADVRVYVGGMGQGFLTHIPKYAHWVYWRPANGIKPTPSNAAEYGADLILDRVDNWTKASVRSAEKAGYQTGVRLTDTYRKATRLGVGYILTNWPGKLLTYCKESS
jgi:glycerophosphoryl diester phosphodiesterase